MNNLTKRQTEIYQYLQAHSDSASLFSIEALCQALGMRSRGSLHKHITALIHAGLIEPMSGKQRGIRLTTTPVNSHSLLFKGNIQAGQPLQSIDPDQRVEIPAHLQTQGECHVYSLKGHSMIEAGLLEEDRLIIEQTSNVKNDDIVLALIDNYEAILRRYENTGAITILHPANGAMKPYVFETSRVKIIGKLVGQMRCYPISMGT